MLTKEELDRFAVGSCADKTCEHGNHGVCFLHSKCHRRAPMWLRLAEPPAEAEDAHPWVVAECVECSAAVVVLSGNDVRLLAAAWGTAKIRLLEPACHPDEGAVWLGYTFGSGIVQVVCYRCGKVAAEIGVQSAAAVPS